jgi:hypothetical protein
VVDINQGLLVLRYQGPHQDEVTKAAFAEGNSNITALGAQASATPTATATPTSRPTPGGSTAQQGGGAFPWLVGAGVFILALAIRVAGGVRRHETARRRRRGS